MSEPGRLPRLPARCAGLFRPVRMIAAGGYGQVWEAHQIGLERAVALKLLDSARLTGEQEVQRFLDEARVTAKLTHPSIVVVLDHDVEDGVPWIAYELLPGSALAQLLERRGALPPAEALEVALQIASALECVHAAGVLHRDLKPGNVLDAGDGRWKLADFGIAKWSAGRVHTATGVILGTPAYLAPEVIQGGAPSASADLYALGALLYETLAGRTPFGGTLPEMLADHVQRPPPPLAMPGGLAALAMRLLAKTPEERPASAAAVHAELTRLRERPDAAPAEGARPAAGRGADTVRLTARRSPVLTSVVESPAPRRAPPVALIAGLAFVALVLVAGIGFRAASGPGTAADPRGTASGASSPPASVPPASSPTVTVAPALTVDQRNDLRRALDAARGPEELVPVARRIEAVAGVLLAPGASDRDAAELVGALCRRLRAGPRGPADATLAGIAQAWTVQHATSFAGPLLAHAVSDTANHPDEARAAIEAALRHHEAAHEGIEALRDTAWVPFWLELLELRAAMPGHKSRPLLHVRRTWAHLIVRSAKLGLELTGAAADRREQTSLKFFEVLGGTRRKPRLPEPADGPALLAQGVALAAGRTQLTSAEIERDGPDMLEWTRRVARFRPIVENRPTVLGYTAAALVGQMVREVRTQSTFFAAGNSDANDALVAQYYRALDVVSSLAPFLFTGRLDPWCAAVIASELDDLLGRAEVDLLGSDEPSGALVSHWAVTFSHSWVPPYLQGSQRFRAMDAKGALERRQRAVELLLRQAKSTGWTPAMIAEWEPAWLGLRNVAQRLNDRALARALVAQESEAAAALKIDADPVAAEHRRGFRSMLEAPLER